MNLAMDFRKFHLNKICCICHKICVKPVAYSLFFFSYVDTNLRLPLSVSDITVYDMIHKHTVTYDMCVTFKSSQMHAPIHTPTQTDVNTPESESE